MDSNRLQKWQEKKRELGLTLDELAEQTGISKRTLTGILKGKDEKYQNPTYTTIKAIEKALGLDEKDTEETTKVELTPQEDRMLEAYRNLNDSSRELIIMLLQSLQK